VSEVRGTFNSFPVAADAATLRRHRRRRNFQFFPSCCRAPSSRSSPRRFPFLSILSQLLRWSSTWTSSASTWSFQFFHSCCRHTWGRIYPTSGGVAFNSFTVAAYRGEHISFLKFHLFGRAFNSFTVAVRRTS